MSQNRALVLNKFFFKRPKKRFRTGRKKIAFVWFLLSGRLSKSILSVASASNPSEVSYGLGFCSVLLEPQACGRVVMGARGMQSAVFRFPFSR